MKYYKNVSYTDGEFKKLYLSILTNNSILNVHYCNFVALTYEYRELIGILDENYVELNTKLPVCSIWISFIELYNEIIFDLLEFSGNKKPLKLSVDKHNNFYVKGKMGDKNVVNCGISFALFILDFFFFRTEAYRCSNL